MIKDTLFGLAVGDALGVPVEFKSREEISRHPVTDMVGYGTYNLPPGTWSDDSSLAFCLAEALTQDFDITIIAGKFEEWLYKGYWTPYGKVFDVGITTQKSIENLKKVPRPDLAGSFSEQENGNGSLMRILPLLYYIKDKPVAERYQLTKAVSSITHGHDHAVIACFYYLEFARGLVNVKDKLSVYRNLQKHIPDYLPPFASKESSLRVFDRLLKGDIRELPEKDIKSSGYVLHTLEASIWCVMTTETYREAVLKAVNLGKDTDTTGAVTGGLAGLLYGFENIPANWVAQLARRDDISDLVNRLTERFGS